MMIKKDHIKQILEDHTSLGFKLLFLFVIVHLFSSTAGHPWLKMLVLSFALFLIVLFVKKVQQSLLWYIFLALLLFDLICNFFGSANHHFLLIYVTILILQFLKNGRLEQHKTNIGFLLVIVLLFSSIQKLISPQFVTGDFYYYMLNTGKFFKPFLYFSQEMRDIIASNNSKILALENTDPNALKSIHLTDILPNIHIISLVLSWFTIAIELLIALLLFLKPKHILTHLLYIMLILSIFFTRLETGFLALLAIGGFWIAERRKVQVIYMSLAILFMAFMIAKIGFY